MKPIEPVMDNKSGYSILLSNGEGWHIMASEGMRLWAERLATMLELKTRDQNGDPKLIFIRGETGKENRRAPMYCLEPNMMENLPRSGWTAHKLPLMQIWSHSDVPDVICEVGNEEGFELDVIRKSLALYPIYRRAQSSGGFPLHGALVEREGMGMVLAASAKTGKSTCCFRLSPPWRTWCDDETLVVRNDRKRYLAHPLPTWSDYLWRRSKKTWRVESHVPLSAIFFLERGKIDQAISMGQGQAAASITRSALEVYHPNYNHLDPESQRTLKKKLFENACDLSLSIPAFKLRVSQRGRFWEAMENVLPKTTKK